MNTGNIKEIPKARMQESERRRNKLQKDRTEKEETKKKQSLSLALLWKSHAM
jgi:hypothetical protein